MLKPSTPIINSSTKIKERIKHLFFRNIQVVNSLQMTKWKQKCEEGANQCHGVHNKQSGEVEWNGQRLNRTATELLKLSLPSPCSSPFLSLQTPIPIKHQKFPCRENFCRYVKEIEEGPNQTQNMREGRRWVPILSPSSYPLKIGFGSLSPINQ